MSDYKERLVKKNDNVLLMLYALILIPSTGIVFLLILLVFGIINWIFVIIAIPIASLFILLGILIKIMGFKSEEISFNDEGIQLLQGGKLVHYNWNSITRIEVDKQGRKIYTDISFFKGYFIAFQISTSEYEPSYVKRIFNDIIRKEAKKNDIEMVEHYKL